MATLDLMSDGRVGCNFVTSTAARAAQDFRLNEHLEHDTRDETAAEFAVAGGLDALAGPEAAFLFGGAAAALALAIGAVGYRPAKLGEARRRCSISAPCCATAPPWPGSPATRSIAGNSRRCAPGA